MSFMKYLVLNATPKAEYFDVHEKGQTYSQRINWSDYAKPSQMYSSEKEWIIAPLLNHNENSLSLDTLKDVFQIKSSNNSFKTKAGRMQFLAQVREQLKKIPYNTMELQRINAFIKEQEKSLDPFDQNISISSKYASTTPCIDNCPHCEECASLPVKSSRHPYLSLTGSSES